MTRGLKKPEEGQSLMMITDEKVRGKHPVRPKNDDIKQDDLFNQIVHEVRDHRHWTRIEIPGFVLFKDIKGKFKLGNLSPGGCSLEIYDDRVTEGSDLALTIILPFESFDLKLHAMGRVIWTDAQTQKTGFQFIDTNDERTELIRRIVTHVLNGEISNIKGLLDLHKEMHTRDIYDAPRHSTKGLSLISRYVALLGIGGILLAFVGFSLHAMIFRVDSSYASVVSPIFRSSAPQGTLIHNIFVHTGESVQKGQPLFLLHDPALDADEIALQAQIATSRTVLEQLKEELAESKTRLVSYQDYLENMKNNLIQEIALLEQTHGTKKTVYERTQEGASYGGLTKNERDDH